MEADVSGIENDQIPPFRINLPDGSVPRLYTFKIKAEVRGNSIYFTRYLSLTIDCPGSATIIPNYIPSAYTYKNAIVGTNDYYEFPSFTTTFPSCY